MSWLISEMGLVFECFRIAFQILNEPMVFSFIHFRNALGHKIVGCPVCIEDKKYERNALMFNVCFVFDSSTRLTHIYGPAVRKLATYLTQLEVCQQ